MADELEARDVETLRRIADTECVEGLEALLHRLCEDFRDQFGGP